MKLRLELDREEIVALLEGCKRQRATNCLRLELSKIEQLLQREKAKESAASSRSDGSSTSESRQQVQIFTRKIQHYGWDQTEKFVKIYVTLDGVQKLTSDRVSCTFNDRSMHLAVHDLNGINYDFSLNNLLARIDVEGSVCKVKTDRLLIFLKKGAPGDKWSHLTATEKAIAEGSKKSSFDKSPGVPDDAEPGSALMGMMQKMYQDGDDDMKRTIAKAWTESREKQGRSGEPPMDF